MFVAHDSVIIVGTHSGAVPQHTCNKWNSQVSHLTLVDLNNIASRKLLFTKPSGYIKYWYKDLIGMSFPTGLESLNYPLIYISHILGSHEKCPFSLCEKNKCKLTLFVLQKPFSRREESVVYGWVYISHDSSTKTALTNMNFIWVHFGNPEFVF